VASAPGAESAPAPNATYSIRGTVFDSEGRGIAGAGVAASLSRSESERVVSSADGAFSFSSLRAGAWFVYAFKPDYTGAGSTARVDDANPTQTITLTLIHRRKVFIRFVTPDGEPLSARLDTSDTDLAGLVRGSICAVATRDPLEKAVPSAASGGTYGIGKYVPSETADKDALGDSKTCDRILEIDDNIGVYVSALLANEVLCCKFVAAGVNDVDLPIDESRLLGSLAKLRFRIAAEDDGSPAPRGSAMLLRVSGGYGKLIQLSADGTAEFTRVPPGWCELMIMYEIPGLGRNASGTITRSVQLVAGECRDLGTVRISKPVSIRGRVVDDAGNPAMCEVQVCELESMQSAWAIQSGPAAKSGADGSFELRNVSRGKQALIVERRQSRNAPNWGRASWLCDTTAGAVENFTITVHKAATATIRTTGNTPRDYSLLGAVFDSNGVCISHDWCMEPIGRAGQWFRVELAPGTYRVFLGDGDRILGEATFALGAEQTVVQVPVK
jgi:hypothetical protein